MSDSSNKILILSKNEKNKIDNLINNIFIINSKDQEGIALFYKTKNQKEIYFSLLIYNNNIEKSNLKENKEEINLSLCNLEAEYILPINNNRKIYLNSKYFNISMIEIKPTDNINKKYINEVDKFSNIQLNDLYINRKVYLIKF